ncbi:MAG: DEAD/DEAH box helicase [Candidatus Pacebacteria bacterium]|jgi:ATP-dependent RNA helicase RhlE|nr:DEAD/DEAH box helicase [Candidatus Paceibacterota bacterium]MBT3511579.1 DEAD/DEAH box helicase [Candidatus Paceibacterota bacterium]MBT4004951.1 DEAD/DEAH box helicase [Candidatus Paceibacterota bacterium]MBT4358727.1 DEAD/DEAH box helicase [Candidatus Paceibacterota bacterium]MBT4680694.1 DEAD/DEAH box helicase [Candidatus Paceibacterota bacterium]
MYRSRRSFSNSRSNQRGGNNRRSGRFSGGRGRMGSFDPSMLIRKAVQNPAPQPTYVVENKFVDFAISDQLKHNIVARGYDTPTPIQDQIIPYILEGRDVVGLANTGTGKTAAFLIPLLDNIYQRKSEKVLIMAPTRELAVQIESEVKLFARSLRINSSLCIGGASINRQIDALRRNPQFVIGTPGRLIDLEKRRFLNFNDFSTIVLDEVDQMFDMGFINDMKYVIANLPQDRHSLFFSATLPSKLDSVVGSFLKDPVMVQVETQKASTNVDQDVIKVNGQSKTSLLQDLLNQEGFDKVLVFGRTKRGLDKLDRTLYQKGFRVAAIHGNKSQGQRQRALKEFKRNNIQVLLATDIASRGLDIDDVTHVINFDLPQTKEDYIHRIGRTGRANKTGIALSFVD